MCAVNLKRTLLSLAQKAPSGNDQATGSKSTSQLIRIGNDFQLHVQGLPPSLTKIDKESILAHIMRIALVGMPDKAERGEEYRGKARIELDGEKYDVEFSLTALRTLMALYAYKIAFDAVNAGAASGIYDQEIAKDTADFLRNSAWQEVANLGNQGTLFSLDSSKPRIGKGEDK
jgi:hypothetical protein